MFLNLKSAIKQNEDQINLPFMLQILLLLSTYKWVLLQATSAIGERSKLQADLESTQAALKAKGNTKVLYRNIYVVV